MTPFTIPDELRKWLYSSVNADAAPDVCVLVRGAGGPLKGWRVAWLGPEGGWRGWVAAVEDQE